MLLNNVKPVLETVDYNVNINTFVYRHSNNLNKFNYSAFTLLELIIYITLALIVSSITLYIYVNTTYGIKDLQKNNAIMIQKMSTLIQLEKQVFAIYKDKNYLKLKDNRLSFYTLYPSLYSGVVRAEYYFNPDEKVLYYEEYPYIDGNLGSDGLKKVVIGRFDSVKFSILTDNEWVDEYDLGKPSKAIKVSLDNEQYFLVLE